jgi:hypothetical protein
MKQGTEGSIQLQLYIHLASMQTEQEMIGNGWVTYFLSCTRVCRENPPRRVSYHTHTLLCINKLRGAKIGINST